MRNKVKIEMKSLGSKTFENCGVSGVLRKPKIRKFFFSNGNLLVEGSLKNLAEQ